MSLRWLHRLFQRLSLRQRLRNRHSQRPDNASSPRRTRGAWPASGAWRCEAVVGSGPGGRIRAADVPLSAPALAQALTPTKSDVTTALRLSAEHFLLAEIDAAALLDWRARLPATSQAGLGSLVLYVAARVLVGFDATAACGVRRRCGRARFGCHAGLACTVSPRCARRLQRRAMDCCSPTPVVVDPAVRAGPAGRLERAAGAGQPVRWPRRVSRCASTRCTGPAANAAAYPRTAA